MSLFSASAELERHDMSAKGAIVPMCVSAVALLVACHGVVNCEASSETHVINADVEAIVDVKIGSYLKVDKKTLWVTVDMIEQLNIMSNVEWTIV